MRRGILQRIIVAGTLAFVLAGCGGGESPAPPAPPVDPATAASISGTVTLDGTPPALHPIDMSANAACVKMNPSPVVPPIVVTGRNQALANTVVYVKSGLGNYRYPAPIQTAVLDQKNCMYAPHVIALMVDQPFEVVNSDPTMHNVHPMPKHNRQWSSSQPAGSAPFKFTFQRAEFPIPVLCNVHPWMRAYAFVFDNPYFAVTSTDGAFDLKNLPPGTYTIEAWQEQYKTLDQTVTLGPHESKSISFTYHAAGS